MSVIKPFRGLRPKTNLAEQVASPPYDVLDSEEAREMAEGNTYSFLHVNKPEIDLDPTVDVYDEKVYQKGAENLKKLISEGIMIQDETPLLYVYRQIMGAHQQTGLVACASVEEYEKNLIKKHEFTRPVKEDDRVNHIKHLNAQVGPVFLTYRSQEEINQLIRQVTEGDPEYNFESPDKVKHIFWVIKDNKLTEKLVQQFDVIDYLYVADGHHRSAAAERIRNMKRDENPSHTGNEAYNYFLVVIFPHDQMQILDYNRVVKDLNGNSTEQFLSRIEDKFTFETLGPVVPDKPKSRNEFMMYLEGNWYKLNARKSTYDENDPVKRLDVSILQENLLTPVLGIGDPRKDKRIDFVGGIRGLSALKKRVDSGEWKVAFALHPTSIEELMAIADSGNVMPPKSTWFEPKLRSGLVVHLLD